MKNMKILIAKGSEFTGKLFELYNEWAKEKVSPKTIQVTLKEFRNQITKSTVFIAKEKEEIMGFLMCRMKKSSENTIMYKLKKGEIYANIDSIFVKKKYRNKSIGSKLVIACKKELKKHGHSKIIVLADSTMPEKLMKFYEKNGFGTLFVSMISDY